MTTIAYRDGILAGDRRACIGDHVAAQKTKVHRRGDGCLVGAAGRSSIIARWLNWFMDGEQGQTPSLGDDDDTSAAFIVVKPDGSVFFVDRFGWFRQEGPYFATGSGWTAAMAAMDMGADARRAVEIAALRDTSTGDGVDVVSLDTAWIATRAA